MDSSRPAASRQDQRRGLRRRERHGRGMRGPLLPASVVVAGVPVRVPRSQSPAERFDEIVLDVVEHLEERWEAELRGVEFAVEDVPPLPAADAVPWDPAIDADLVADETAGGAVPLGRLLPATSTRAGEHTPARVVVYRRPLELRAVDALDLRDLVHDVVVDQVARLLGLDPDQVDPPA